MNLLLDTHAFLWFVGGDTALSRPGRDAIEDPGNSCFVSMAFAWELSIKSSLGKIEFTEPFESFLPEQLKLNADSQRGQRLRLVRGHADMVEAHAA